MDFADGLGLALYVILEREEDDQRRVVIVEVN